MQKSVAVFLSKYSRVKGAVKARGLMTIKAKFVKAFYKTRASIEELISDTAKAHWAFERAGVIASNC